MDENGKVYENLDVANFLNDYYVNVGPNLAEKHKKNGKKADKRNLYHQILSN